MMKQQIDNSRNTGHRRSVLRLFVCAAATAMLVTATSLLTAACSTDAEYSAWPCRFLYDNAVHLDQTLATAMNAQSRGIFCRISETSIQGVRHLSFANSDGLESTQRETAAESQTHYVLGLCNAIIVGYQTLNESPNGGFIAYDAQCPNCVRAGNANGSSKYMVSINQQGMATCPNCRRQYMLNNRGIVVNGEKGDRKLEVYGMATTTGPFGFISVFSK